MTNRQIELVGAGLKAGRTGWARPQQVAVLSAILAKEGGLASDKPEHKAVLEAFGPFCNASQTLQDLKRLGVITAEPSTAQKAQAAAILASLE